MAVDGGVYEGWRHEVAWDTKMTSEQMRQQFEAEGQTLSEIVNASRALPEGEIVGHVMRFPRGDGIAMYIVTSDDPLTLAHIPYGDAWSIEPALIRGINKEDVLEDQAQQRGLEAIFKKGSS